MKIKLKTQKEKYINGKLKIKLRPETKNPKKTKGSKYV
jgi:hypothetical protein